MIPIQLDLFARDRSGTGRHPRSRWATQALVFAAGDDGVTAAGIASARVLAPGTIRRHLRHLRALGRVVRRDGRWFSVETGGAP